MAKTIKKARETDNYYFLKILVYFLLGMLWIKVNGVVVLPAGLIVGLLIAQHDRFAIDRKIEYAVLLVACLVGLSLAAFMLSFWL